MLLAHFPLGDFFLNEEIPKLFPLNSEELTVMWWSEFIDLGGWECFDSEKEENELRKEKMDFNSDLEENGFRA